VHCCGALKFFLLYVHHAALSSDFLYLFIYFKHLAIHLFLCISVVVIFCVLYLTTLNLSFSTTTFKFFLFGWFMLPSIVSRICLLWQPFMLFYIYRISLILIYLLDIYHHAKYLNLEYSILQLKHGNNISCFVAIYLESSSRKCCQLHMRKETGHTTKKYPMRIFISSSKNVFLMLEQ
jgi:hypothetical protein